MTAGLLPDFGAPTLQNIDASNMQPGQRLRGNNRQYVRFYKKKYMQPYATDVQINELNGATKVLKTGVREIEREFVEIITPGDKNTVDDFAEDFHKREHWREYEAFRQGKAAPLGQPIDDCSFISQPIATELKFFGVHTVEQLADASDILCQRVQDGYSMREYARAVCKCNVENKSLSQVNVLKAELEEAKRMISEMQAKMGIQSAPKVEEVSGPNRSPKKPKTIEVS